MRYLILYLLLSGCGYGLRGEIGPAITQDEGGGGTVQVTALLPVIAGSGLVDLWVVGGWATTTQHSTSGGVLFGTEIMLIPGGFDVPKNEPREGFGGAGRFHPRVGNSGFDFGGGLALMYGSGETLEMHSWSPGGFFGARWRDVVMKSYGLAVQVHRNVDDGLLEPGPWRGDALFVFEWLKVTD